MSAVLRVRSAVVLTLIGVGALLTGCPNAAIVIFPDEALETAIRTELRIPFGFITQGHLLELRSLDARNFGVRDLRGLEFARNLTSLDVSTDVALQNAVRNLAPLADLTNLRFLDMENNDITDITPVAGLFNIDELYLAGNPVFNIGPLVANAENGGLGAGDSVTLTRDTLLDDEGGTSEIVSEQLNRLVELGVDVILVEFNDAQQ
jgi:hypothetical protein